jgi:hypothetical protein
MCYLSIINLTFRDPYTGETAYNRVAWLLGWRVGIYYKGVSCSQDGNLGATSFSGVTSKTLINIPENSLGGGPAVCPPPLKTRLEEREEELEWFVGFSEAESMFFISKSGALSFKIKLHWDDRQTLLYIKKLLSELAGRDVGVIVDSKDNHESYFTIAKFKDIQEILIPIFTKYHFTTSKYLDFQDFCLAAVIKNSSVLSKRKLRQDELEKILSIKSGMNSLRIQFNVHDIPKRPLTPNRLLGFIEGDGSFCITSMIPVFTIKQHSKNVHFLYEIAEYLNTIPYNPDIGPKQDNLNTRPVVCISNSGFNSSILSVTNILQLYNYVLPFFNSLTFRSRKAVDFQLWVLAVKLKALGYTTKPEGKKCYVEINKYINKRYTSNVELNQAAPDIKIIYELLNSPPVFDLSSGLSYKALSDIVKVNNKGNSGYGVNVYDNGVLVQGSPFSSYTQAAIALGNINISSAISKKIDTDKLYKGRYRFESTSL